jgi:hypothetical protein
VSKVQNDCGTEQSSGAHQERQQASEDPVPPGKIGRSLSGAIREQELVFQEKRLHNHATDTARSEQTDQRSKEMDEKNHQMTRRRIVAGGES